MPDYDFRNLSSVDFEILIRDLLQEKLGVVLEDFKAGRDQGIDLRYCATKDEKLIVQCKHYAESGYRPLLTELKKEVLKVKKLEPTSYIVAVSIGLSAQQKDEILDLFRPYIKSPEDILHKESINNFLGLYPSVEKRQFKLWFSSVGVFESILNQKSQNVTEDTLLKIRERSELYVQNDSFGVALEILENHHFCVIAGVPGIGKTTLAEMLVLQYLQRGYDFVRITGDISEAQSSEYRNTRRIFYYDDFLGTTSTAEKFNKNEDQNLLEFISALRKSATSKLILTTREYILNSARRSYEKIEQWTIANQTCIVALEQYTRKIRSHILFNHVYFSCVPDTYKKSLVRHPRFLEIVDHKNYSPRLIEFFTDIDRLDGVTASTYGDAFLKGLDNPTMIWKHAFENQLATSCKNLLLTLATLPRMIRYSHLERAFWKFHRTVSLAHNSPTNPNDYKDAVKELDGTFIATQRTPHDQEPVVSFHNPSIADFLEELLISKKSLALQMANAFVFFEQIEWIWYFEKQHVKTPLRHVLQNNPTLLISQIRSAFEAPSCRVRKFNLAPNSAHYLIQQPFEERLEFILSAYSDTRNEDLKVFLLELFDLLARKLKSNRGNGTALLSLFQSADLKGVTDTFVTEELSRLVKEFVLHDCVDLDSFSLLTEFFGSFEEMFSDEEMDVVREEFLTCIEDPDYIVGDTRDPDEMRSLIETIDSIAEELQVGVSGATDAIEELAERAESFDYDDHSIKSAPRNTSESGFSDRDVNSMFDRFRG